MRTYRIACLTLRQIHHALHVAPIAFELSLRPGYEVTLYTSHEPAAQFLRDVGRHYPDHRCEIVVLKPPWYQSALNLKRRTYPRPKSVLKRNAAELLAADAVVSSDFYSLSLLKLRTGSRPLFVKTPHGAGAGAYGFKQALTRYDLLLGPGEYFRARLERTGLIDRVDYELVGYPKLEIAEQMHRDRKPLFDNDLPVILYNPHFKDQLSSWPAWGFRVLDYFHAEPRYNLIFAPHINLFARRHTRAKVPARYADAANILVDLGSPASVDMTYTRHADLYLGDVSSQVMEFIHRPRPCVFLNAHKVDWQGDIDYAAWHLGRVLDDIDDLGDALGDALTGEDPFRGAQVDAFERLVADPQESAALRAAEAIARRVERVGNDNRPQSGHREPQTAPTAR